MNGGWAARVLFLVILTVPAASAATPEVQPAGLECKVDRALAAMALVRAYPTMIASADESTIYWQDGFVSPLGDIRADAAFDTLLKSATVAEQFLHVYPLTPAGRCRLARQDPGRLRNEEFFIQLYGDCRGRQTRRPNRTVRWLANSAPQAVQITSSNGLDRTVEALSQEIEALPWSIGHVAAGLAGTFACRTVLGTRQLSMHAYAAAIDLDQRFGRYWRWSGAVEPANVQHRVPPELVQAFEKYGFIWGGNWYHIDSFHFEYRPELIWYARLLAERTTIAEKHFSQ